jgi:hypothetical protein
MPSIFSFWFRENSRLSQRLSIVDLKFVPVSNMCWPSPWQTGSLLLPFEKTGAGAEHNVSRLRRGNEKANTCKPEQVSNRQLILRARPINRTAAKCPHLPRRPTIATIRTLKSYLARSSDRDLSDCSFVSRAILSFSSRRSSNSRSCRSC